MTHGISFLPHVDYIYVMRNGRISEHGQYDELMHKRGAFAEFLSNYIADVDPELSEEAEGEWILSIQYAMWKRKQEIYSYWYRSFVI